MLTDEFASNSDSKLFMHLFTLQLNSLYNVDATLDAQPVGEGQRHVVAVSANPGFVRSDIWRSMWKVSDCRKFRYVAVYI